MIRSFITIAFFGAMTAFLFGGCSDDTTNTADTQAPTVSILQPAAGDTVGIFSMTAVCNASDNTGVTRLELFIDGSATPAATVQSAPWQAVISIQALADGDHTLSAKAVDAAGNVGTSTTVTFVKGIRSADVVKRMALTEITTSANCGPCGPENLYYHTATSNAYYQERVATIKYHGPIPRSTDSLWKASQTVGLPRMTYLFNPIPFANAGFPNAWVGGEEAGSSAQNWMAFIDEDLKKTAEAKIEVTRNVTLNDVTLSIRVTGISTAAYGDLRLHTVITQSNINYNDGNSENIHHEVMVTMLPDANGEAVTIGNGASAIYPRTFTLKPEWKLADMEAVVFLQSHSTKHILQAAKLALQ